MAAVSSAASSARSRMPGRIPGLARVLAAATCCGLCAGAVGMVLTLFIDAIEHLVFGRAITSGWLGTAGLSTLRVLLGITLGGLSAGTIWWRIRPATGSLTSIEDAVTGRRLDLRTVVDAFTQLLVVGTGSSIGKEVAPGR